MVQYLLREGIQCHYGIVDASEIKLFNGHVDGRIWLTHLVSYMEDIGLVRLAAQAIVKI
jgi:hypothetical protein